MPLTDRNMNMNHIKNLATGTALPFLITQPKRPVRTIATFVNGVQANGAVYRMNPFALMEFKRLAPTNALA